MPRSHIAGLVAACGLLIMGCQEPTPVTPGANTTSAIDEAAAQIPLEIKSWDEVQAWVAEQRGKVVVVDVWSTYCIACMREFPHFVEFHKDYGDRVACGSLSIDFFGGEGDDPEEVREQVLEFLTANESTMSNFISSDSDSEVLKQLDAAAIPVALVYDREGKLHTVFNNDDEAYGPNGFNYENHITPLVEQLLAAGE